MKNEFKKVKNKKFIEISFLMDYLVTIPTTRERGYEIVRCIQSITRDTTYKGYPILVFGQTNDPTLPVSWREAAGRELEIIYAGPYNLERMMIYLEEKSCINGLNRQNLRALFNYRTYGGARNILTALAFLLSTDPAVIGLDDDEEVKDGFFGEHVRILGTKTSRNKKITLVTGPYENHDSYVGLDTLAWILARKREEAKVKDALRSITYVERIREGYEYGIQGARGGNTSRCSTALLIPYISSREDIPMRGEDEVQADMNQLVNPKTLNVYTPKAVVRHTKREGYIVDAIKGEIIGIIVHAVISELLKKYGYEEMRKVKEEELQELIDQNTEETIKNAKQKLNKKARFSYSHDLKEELRNVMSSVYSLFCIPEFISNHALIHLQTALFGFRYWNQIIDCLANAPQQNKRYILGLS